MILAAELVECAVALQEGVTCPFVVPFVAELAPYIVGVVCTQRSQKCEIRYLLFGVESCDPAVVVCARGTYLLHRARH